MQPNQKIPVNFNTHKLNRYGGEKYNATRDLINAVPDVLLVSFDPQVLHINATIFSPSTIDVVQIGNGLCAAPVVSDLSGGLNPLDALGGKNVDSDQVYANQALHATGQCMSPGETGAPWTLTRLDDDCRRADGSVKINWFGIQ